MPAVRKHHRDRTLHAHDTHRVAVQPLSAMHRLKRIYKCRTRHAVRQERYSGSVEALGAVHAVGVQNTILQIRNDDFAAGGRRAAVHKRATIGYRECLHRTIVIVHRTSMCGAVHVTRSARGRYVAAQHTVWPVFANEVVTVAHHATA